jgi:hypothetical protein
LAVPHDDAVVVDALGGEHSCELEDGRLTVRVSVTPVFLIASRAAVAMQPGTTQLHS